MATTRKSDAQKSVEALEGELERFDRLAGEATSIGFDSRKNLERAARLLEQLTEASERLDARASELSAALAAIRGRREATTKAIAGWGGELKPRADAWVALRSRFEALGAAATSIDRLLQASGADVEGLGAAEQALHTLLADLDGIGADAREQGFKDIARDVEGQRGTLAAVVGKLAAYRQQLN